MKFGICGGPGTNILIDIEGQLEAERTPCLKGGGQEELPHVRGQGQWPRVPDCDGAGTAERSYPTPEARGSGREEHFELKTLKKQQKQKAHSHFPFSS